MAHEEVYIACQLWTDSLLPSLQKLLPNVSFKTIKLRNAILDQFIWDIKLAPEDIAALQPARIVIADNQLIGQFAFDVPNLRWVQGSFAGVDILFKQIGHLFKTKGYPQFVATRFTGDSYGKLMTEYCLAHIINHERSFRDHQLLQYTKDWAKLKKVTRKPYRILSELTIGVLGTGSIGFSLSRQLKAQGCTVVGYSRRAKSLTELSANGIDYFSTDLKDVLPQCDYVVSILPETPETIGLFNDDLFEICKEKKPVFINIGRGSVISSLQIVKALDQDWLSGAVLDVFEEEPLPEANPLWDHPKVVITPHIAAETRPQDLVSVFVDNYKKFVEGRTLDFAIDFKSGY